MPKRKRASKVPERLREYQRKRRFEVTPEPPPPTMTHAATSALELTLDGGRRLSIGPGFDAPTLQRLLALLEEGRP